MDQKGNGEEGGAKQGSTSLEDAWFGTLYTLGKEKEQEKKIFVVARVVVEFSQLILFTLSGNNVGMWGWHINFQGIFWRWFNYLQLENPMTNTPTGGHTLWLAFFYILAVVLCVSVGLCVFVAVCFKHGTFPVVWPVKLLRAIISVVFSLLFVSSLDVFLVAVACVPNPVTQKGCMIYNFPGSELLSDANLVHGIIGMIMSATIISISFFITMGESEQNFLTDELMASFDSAHQMRRFVFCTIATLSSNFIIDYRKPLSIVLLFCFGSIFVDLMRSPPHFHDAANYMSAVTGSLLLWSSVMLVVKMYTGSAPPLSEIYPSLYPDPDDPVLGAASAFAAPPPLASAAALAAAVNGTLANGTSGSPLYYGAPGSMQALPPPISLGALSASASAAGGLPPPDDNSKLLTEIGFYLAPVIALLAVGAMHIRLRSSKRVFYEFLSKVRELDAVKRNIAAAQVADALPHIQFNSVAEVEACLRPMRDLLFIKPDAVAVGISPGAVAPEHGASGGKKRADLKGGEPSPVDPAVKLAAEALMLSSLRQHGATSALMNILYGCFLLEVMENTTRGYVFLDKARRLRLSMRERFMIFVRDRQRTQRAQSDSVGSGAMDLVSYVEFQTSFSSVMNNHRSALRANRSFWRMLVNPAVSFHALCTAFEQMDTAEAQADATYRAVVERYPKSTKLLRSFAEFLEEVRSNPWAARRYREEADKVEETSADSGELGGMQINEETDGVVMMDHTSTITVVNKRLAKLFGYRRTEDLVGKPVTILMAPPHDHLHNTYVETFLRTGVSHLLGQRQMLEGKHQRGHTFPINILVSKNDTGGAVSFVAVITEREAGGSTAAASHPAGPGVVSDASLHHHPRRSAGPVTESAGASPVRLAWAEASAVLPAALPPLAEEGEQQLAAPPAPASSYPADVVARARKAHCVFFQDDTSAPPAILPPHPVPQGASVSSCPFMSAARQKSASESSAPSPAAGAAPSGGCAFAAASEQAAPPPVEAAIVASRLIDASSAVRAMPRGTGAIAERRLRQAVELAQGVEPRSEADWDALLYGLVKRPSTSGLRRRRRHSAASSAGGGDPVAVPAPAPAAEEDADADDDDIAAMTTPVEVFSIAVGSEQQPGTAQPRRWTQAVAEAFGEESAPPLSDPLLAGGDGQGGGDGSAGDFLPESSESKHLQWAPSTKTSADAILALKQANPLASSDDEEDDGRDGAESAVAPLPGTPGFIPVPGGGLEQGSGGKGGGGPKQLGNVASWQSRDNPSFLSSSAALSAALLGGASGDPAGAAGEKKWGAQTNSGRMSRPPLLQLQLPGASSATKPPFATAAGAAMSEHAESVMADDDGLKDAEALKRKQNMRFQQARRFRQLQRLLGTLQMRQAVTTLRTRLRYVLVLFFVTYLAGFVVVQIQLKALAVALIRCQAVSQLSESFAHAATNAGVIRALTVPPLVNMTGIVLESVKTDLLSTAQEINRLLQGIYMGFGTRTFAEPEVFTALNNASMVCVLWADDESAAGGHRQPSTFTPWKAARKFQSHASVVGTHLGTYEAKKYLVINRDFHFILDNAATIFDSYHDLQRLETSAQLTSLSSTSGNVLFALVAMILVFFASMLYTRHLLQVVASTRIHLFSVFLIIPSSVVTRLASRTVRTSADDGDDADMAEDLWEPNPLAAGESARNNGRGQDSGMHSATSWARRNLPGRVHHVWLRAATKLRLVHGGLRRVVTHTVRIQSRLRSTISRSASETRNSITGMGPAKVKIDTKGRTLDASGAVADAYMFLYTLLLFGALTIVSFGVTYFEVSSMAPHLVNVDASALEAAFAVRVRMFASSLVIGVLSNISAAEVTALQAQLRNAANDLLLQHDSLLSGNTTLGYPGSLYTSPARKQLLFGVGCLKSNRAACYARTDPFYSRTQFGLDTLVRSYVKDAIDLAKDEPEQLSLDNKRYQFIWKVGAEDLHDGLDASSELYEEEAQVNVAIASILQSVVLPLIIVGNFVFLSRFFNPWLARVQMESKRIAELLAQLPKEVNVESMLLEAMGVVKPVAPPLKALEGKRSAAIHTSGRGVDAHVKKASSVDAGARSSDETARKKAMMTNQDGRSRGSLDWEAAVPGSARAGRPIKGASETDSNSKQARGSLEEGGGGASVTPLAHWPQATNLAAGGGSSNLWAAAAATPSQQ